jgi:hypothetical protein
MTKQEFLDGIKQGAHDLNDPDSQFSQVVAEGHELSAELSEFDPMMGAKVEAIVTAIQDLGTYIKLRGEG